jgi:outer membrane protein assembly factor BamD
MDPKGAMKKALLLTCGLLAGCSSRRDVDVLSIAGRSDRLVWEAGQKSFDKRRWIESRQHFRRIVDGFPNSEYAPLARLRLGDTYFKDGGLANYVLAASEYRQFLTLYPSHDQSDYAQFQVAECFFQQRHGPDRDQTPTQDALDEYQKVIDHYPQSAHVEPAKDRIRECREGLARSEHLVGHFYQRTRQAYRSAVTRYQRILADYPEYPRTDEVLLRLGECLIKSGKKEDAVPHLRRLVAEYPESRFASEGQELLGSLK